MKPTRPANAQLMIERLEKEAKYRESVPKSHMRGPMENGDAEYSLLQYVKELEDELTARREAMPSHTWVIRQDARNAKEWFNVNSGWVSDRTKATKYYTHEAVTAELGEIVSTNDYRRWCDNSWSLPVIVKRTPKR